MSECWERRAIDGIRTRLAVLENWASLSRGGGVGGAGEPGHALAWVLFEAWLSQSPILSCITNNQGQRRRINPPSCLQSSI